MVDVAYSIYSLVKVTCDVPGNVYGNTKAGEESKVTSAPCPLAGLFNSVQFAPHRSGPSVTYNTGALGTLQQPTDICRQKWKLFVSVAGLRLAACCARVQGGISVATVQRATSKVWRKAVRLSAARLSRTGVRQLPHTDSQTHAQQCSSSSSSAHHPPCSVASKYQWP